MSAPPQGTSYSINSRLSHLTLLSIQADILNAPMEARHWIVSIIVLQTVKFKVKHIGTNHSTTTTIDVYGYINC